MARAKARARRQERKDAEKKTPRPLRTSLTVSAELTSIKTAKAQSTYGGSDGNALEVSFKVKMGKPEKMPSWEEYRRQNSWQLQNDLARKAKPAAPPKRKKAETDEKYQERTGIDPKAKSEPVTKAFDIEAEIDKVLRPRYDARCAQIAAHNARVMNGASAYAMFFALMNSSVQLRISPAQQGFTEMFSGSGDVALLGAGDAELPEEEDADDQAGDED